MSLPETTPEAGPASRPADGGPRAGIAAAVGAYGLWGFLPILFGLLSAVAPATIVAQRTLWSLVLVGAVLLVVGRFGEVRAVLANRRTVGLLFVSALLLAGNWLLYVWAVESGQLLEASFGYFINPLVNVALGLVLLGERQTRWQWVAIGIAVVAVGIQAVGLGRVPYIALALAFSFGIYGYVRKTVVVGSVSGLFVETLLLAPFMALYTALVIAAEGPWFLTDPTTLLLLIATGPMTAVPLMLFAYGVKRLRLATIGMIQYLAPSIQFVLAITVFAEPLDPVRLASFALIWVSLALYSFDSFRRRGARPATAAGAIR